MTRRPYVAGNWKMNLDRASAVALARAVREHVGAQAPYDCALFAPAVYVAAVAEVLAGSPVKVGVQNVHDMASGAYTGEISVAMAKDVGAASALVGHSERRALFGEADAFLAKKAKAVLDGGLELVFCVGETLAEREAGRTEAVVETQLRLGLGALPRTDWTRVAIAYEPVWAIGTGRNATPAQAGEVHTFLRALVGKMVDAATAEALRIQYGGSVSAANAAELLAVPGIDGALVGGASLKIESLRAILDAARR
ncbi:MAG: triose-phosphate isomerase [Planctomycetes bacterium]|nr:triose-phosphate isomerase [Planctomycetota bacterium]